MKSKPKKDGSRRVFFKTAGLLAVNFTWPELFRDKQNIKIDMIKDQIIEIHTGNKTAILISIFTVDAKNEQKLIDLFEEGTKALFSKQPGYISSSIHKGNDARRLVLYGQWESQQHIEAFRKVSEIGEYFLKVKSLATFESIVCNEVPFVHHV